ncbi:MAG TPA: ESPR domain-containing protein [Rhodanobacteraceae bacterium]|nr:ESPR domain-containing protein [Rhodanobacteraceae bacterium]
MNRHYSLVWNRALCVLQVVSELARPAARGDGALRDARAPCVHRLAAACLLGLCATHAAPTWAAQDFTIAPANGDITGAALGASLDAGNVTILSSSGASLGTGNVNVL